MGDNIGWFDIGPDGQANVPWGSKPVDPCVPPSLGFEFYKALVAHNPFETIEGAAGDAPLCADGVEVGRFRLDIKDA